MHTPIIRFGTVILFAFLQGGCISTVSHRSPFQEYVGRELKTQRTTILHESGAWESNTDMLFSPPQKALYLEDIPRYQSGYRVKVKNRVAMATLPPGQQVRLLEVRQQVGDGSITYDAIGEVYVPSWKRFVRFHYIWGFGDRLHRAPWEPASAPTARTL